MEWVETTGRTIEEAKEAALDQLGVDENEAEFEVLEEPRGGLFGRLRSEARVRARVRPTTPRPKLDRRDRRRRRPAGAAQEGEGAREAERPPRRRERQRAQRTKGQAAKPEPSDTREGRAMAEEPSLEQQATVVEEFVGGLVEAFGYDGDTRWQTTDDDTVEVLVEGEHLGLLIGPRGQTLEAIQELARTVLQRHTVGAPNARVRVDVAGYRQRRKEALERFAAELAEEVRSSGVQKVLEPMNPADRKVVHDAVNAIEGVRTTSEGEEPRRRVVIMPEEVAG